MWALCGNYIRPYLLDQINLELLYDGCLSRPHHLIRLLWEFIGLDIFKLLHNLILKLFFLDIVSAIHVIQLLLYGLIRH